MTDDGYAELDKLKSRLEALGVKIQSGTSHLQDPKHQAESPPREQTERSHHDDVRQLAQRCSQVEAAMHTSTARMNSEHRPRKLSSPEPPRPSTAKAHIRPHTAHELKLPPSPPRRIPRKGGKSAFVSTVRQVPHTGRSSASPLSGLLADYKEAEARWNKERAELRRELANEKKKTRKLEAEVTKMGNLNEARLVDVKALRTALHNRDQQVQEAVMQSKHLEEGLLKANDRAAEELASVARERDDLKALLMATLKRLESVDRVVQRADMSNAVMEERVAELEAQRAEAVDAAAAAQARIEALLKAQRRMEWQNKLLDRISEVQLYHNREKTAAIHELLEPQNKTSDQGRPSTYDDDEATMTIEDDQTDMDNDVMSSVR